MSLRLKVGGDAESNKLDTMSVVGRDGEGGVVAEKLAFALVDG